MQMAIDVAGFSAAEADELRQAMGSKRSHERMERLRGRLYEGMAKNDITGEIAVFEAMAVSATEPALATAIWANDDSSASPAS